MDVTKLEHACLLVRKGDATLVIDPGNFTRPVDAVGVVAVVVTHEHPDHVTPEQLRRIVAANPDARVFGPAGVARLLAEQTPEIAVEVVTHGDARTVGPFALAFRGTTHAVIHSSVPVIDNTGVIVDDTLFSPGDAFTDPGQPIAVLATPVGAPWLKIAEVMDYVRALAPARTFPVHEATLSEAGFAMHADRIASMTVPVGEPIVLRAGETLHL